VHTPGRVKSISDVHKLLQETQWDWVEVAHLAERVVYGVLGGTPVRDRVRVSVDAPDAAVRVGAKQAFKLGLILNELTTNSVKYAFGDEREGKIEIRVKPVDAEKACLEFSDTGPGWPADVLNGQRQNVGLELIKTWIEYDMGGQVTLRNANGAVMECVFKLSQEN
jgi:two-component sensor histidine kinase